MKENEAIKDLDIIRFNPHWDELVKEEYWQEIMEMSIKALEEVQQYRTIGTPEECRAAVEKQKPKKPVMDGYCGFESYECPTCHHDMSNEQKYCDKCGQKLGDDDWHHRGLGRAVEIVKMHVSGLKLRM